MSSREFLNVAHATFVEEVMRSRTVNGTTVAGMSLEEALEYAAPFAEGYVEPDRAELPPAGTTETVATPPRQQSGQKSEEEIVAQNELAMGWLTARMATVSGGLTAKAPA